MPLPANDFYPIADAPPVVPPPPAPQPQHSASCLSGEDKRGLERAIQAELPAGYIDIDALIAEHEQDPHRKAALDQARLKFRRLDEARQRLAEAVEPAIRAMQSLGQEMGRLREIMAFTAVTAMAAANLTREAAGTMAHTPDTRPDDSDPGEIIGGFLPDTGPAQPLPVVPDPDADVPTVRAEPDWPPWARWLATDPDGHVWLYADRPWLAEPSNTDHRSGGWYMEPPARDRVAHAGTADPRDWLTSLRRIVWPGGEG